MKKKVFKLKCTSCGAKVTRNSNRKNTVTCFSCKKERTRKHGYAAFIKRRAAKAAALEPVIPN